MNIRETVIHQMQVVAEQQNKQLAPLNDNLLLAETGWIRSPWRFWWPAWTMSLGYPFSNDMVTATTLGQLVSVYEQAGAV